MYKAFERIRDFVCIFDNHRIITFCNQSLLTHLNYSSLVGASLDDILLPNDAWAEEKCKTTGKYLLTLKNAQEQKVVVYSEDPLPLSYNESHQLLITYPYEDIFYTKKDLEQILDQLPFDIWVKNKSGQYLYVNQKHIDWLKPHTARMEYLGQEESLYWDEELSQYFSHTDAEVFSSGHAITIPEVISVDDTDVYWQTHKIPITYNNDPVGAVLGTTHIPINNNHLEVSLAHANRQLTMLYQFTQYAFPDFSTRSILNRVSSMITQYLNAPALCILSYDQETSSLVACTSSGLFEHTIPVQTRIPISKELLKNILMLEHNYLFINLEDKANLHPCYNDLIDLLDGLNLSCLNQYLIKDENELWGLISIGYTTSKPYPSLDNHFIKTLCNQIYNLIKSSSLLEKAQTEVEKGKLIEKQTIELEKAMAIESMKNEFFINISHELKTPINILLSTYNLLEYFYSHDMLRVDEEVDLHKYIGIMRQNAYRLLRLITNLIDITKIESGEYPLQLGYHNVVHLIEETTLSITSYVESKHIELVFDTDIEECFILCDPEKIERIMFNLLSNAVKYMPGEGNIYVTITHTPSHLQVSVKDTGLGIPSDKLAFIFQRFGQVDTTLSRPAEGSGIGLSLVHALVEMHQGRIWVESELGQGSEFIFELPIPLFQHFDSLDSQSATKSYATFSQNSIERCVIEFSDIYC